MGNKQSSNCLNGSARFEKYDLERKTTLRQNFLCNLLRKSRWFTAFFTRTNLTNSNRFISIFFSRILSIISSKLLALTE
ncbi:unnamed protein product [Onchocerca flexuosa]|uniref:Uncharacterized protein n=1 Tax=Onchocerca flexuosa TaxID=387005 RepID=A0A183HXE9_9BILA|nr:unnamed protein product [Onchocerca flexuosa]